MSVTKSRLHSIPLLPSSYPGRMASRNSTRHDSTTVLYFQLLCSVEFFFISTLHGPHGKHRLLLTRIVLGVFTTPLHSNGRGADHTEDNLLLRRVCRGHVFTESLPSSGYPRHSTYALTYMRACIHV
jgi:hypothetical protein